MNSGSNESAIVRLRNITAFISASYEAVAEKLGFSLVQFEILAFIFKNHPCNISDISDQLWLDKSTTSRLLDKLEKTSWIRIQPDPGDKRRKLVILALSDENRERVLPVAQEWADLDKAVYGKYGEFICRLERRIAEEE